MHHFVLRARYSEVDQLAGRLLEALPEVERSERVRLGLAEALANAILHGALRIRRYVGVGRDEHGEGLEGPRADGLGATPDASGVTLWAGVGDGAVSIYDGGPGFDWRAAMRCPGRGLALMRHVFDDVQWNEAGNCVRLVIASEQAPRAAEV